MTKEAIEFEIEIIDTHRDYLNWKIEKLMETINGLTEDRVALEILLKLSDMKDT